MAKSRKQPPEHPDDVRMTIGEHLDELRGCLIRSLLAVFAACLICMYPARWIFQAIAAPAIIVLSLKGQDVSFLQTGPTEGILVYIKVVLIAALLLSGPYVLYQVWSFVATGLHLKERQYVHKMIWPSVGLFISGVVFMYFLVLPLALNFLIGFADFLPRPDTKPNALIGKVLGIKPTTMPTSQPSIEESPRVPFFVVDPEDPPEGHMWVNISERKLKIRTADDVLAVQMRRDKKRGMLDTHFKIGEYLSFVLMLTIAFGLCFQMPLVVVFLVRTGIVPAATLRKNRKLVILGIVIIAGILAPPDLLSHLLLSGPMLLLFEIGLIVAGKGPRKREDDEETSAA